MKKLFGRLVLLGVAAGALVAVAGYLKGDGPARDVAQITYSDGSTGSLLSNTPEGEELADIARKLVEMGV